MLTKEEIKELTSVRNQLYSAKKYLNNNQLALTYIAECDIDKLDELLNDLDSEIQEQNHKMFKEENYIENIINEVK